jgi:sec-independent protein translocase protein TatB
MFRQLGRFTGKLRSMARDFQRTMEQAADEAGVKDVAKDLRAATSPKALGIDAVREAANRFEKWDPLKPAAAKPNVAVGPKTAAAAAPAAAPAAPAAAAGPATQALMDQKAERHRIAMEAAEKMRGVGKAPAPAGPAPGPAKAAVTRKPRAPKAQPAADAPGAAAPKPRSRKPKAEA